MINLITSKIKLNRRERNFISAGISFIVIFFIIQFGIYPFMEKKELLKRKISVNKKIIETLMELKFEADSIKKASEISVDIFQQRDVNFTLFSFLDKLAGEAGIKDKVVYMKPSTSTSKGSNYKNIIVEIKLQSIGLEQLISFMHMVETSKNIVFIKRMTISQASQADKLLTATLQAETLEPQ
ncbi:MAG: hypothetical protein HQK76_03235 [Desulfobacterales bacterium]|nr:hypothetical protein [Desulfobacterales bacterium]